MWQTIAHLFSPRTSNNHRPRILHLEGLLVVGAILVGCKLLVGTLSTSHTIVPAVLGFSSSITASQVVAQTNEQRTNGGLAPLSIDGKLVSAAIAKGNNMCADQYWAHISPSGITPWVFIKNAGYQYSVAGENLARDFSDTSSMVAAWMASPTHRENIMNPRYEDIGVAAVNCSLLGSDTTLVVQMFGSKLVNTPTISTKALTTAQPLPPSTPSPQVAGEESVPKLLADANPTLSLGNSHQPQTLFAFTPLQIMKSIMLSILIVLLVVLALDMWLTHRRHTVRIAGKNIAHILFLVGIGLVVLLTRAGSIF
ncbi:hypothetical protein C5B42_05770 [Candidatus Cerribacteria bacterium 'Amazon FNV 2010 28 9']|uniref:SCP domain-containing protein n=1 Tax=Candidatus Cerribacteria bacterium 'Amazon FNV 2010 28 9' TaxID=2081795 RepID=A0A317JRV7_9BACT|nr:MAG: hypothetical protein C5B42_05770 [Candidatus Cerribacteria bacterium 'Amazon FNV 2010 28 9']